MQQIILVLLSTFLLSNCMKTHRPYNAGATAADPAAVKIAEAAGSINDSMLKLAMIRKAETNYKDNKINTNFNSNIPGLKNLISVDWNGPLENLVDKLAKSGGLKLVILGNPPKIPVLISIKQQNEELGNILKNINYMAGNNANINVTNKRELEIKYAN